MRVVMRTRRLIAIASTVLLVGTSLRALSQPTADHHQHLFSPTVVERSSGLNSIAATDLIRFLDEVGIVKATVLSLAYQFGNPDRSDANEYELVKAENDWTSQQIAPFADRLIGFCSFNPLAAYALAELERCAGDPNLASGIKLHFGNSDVDLDNPQHVEKVREVFAAANGNRMSIVVHLRPSVSKRRPYGAVQATTFLNDIVSAAPDVIVQVAHLSGAGSYDDATDDALAVFARAIQSRSPLIERIYFDASGVAGIGPWEEKADLIARRIRELGLSRIVFGSDAAVPGNRPKDAWANFLKLALSEEEFSAIAGNVAPHLR
jgi:predicted TIM-barrel fold metal-dependent hydrolase